MVSADSRPFKLALLTIILAISWKICVTETLKNVTKTSSTPAPKLEVHAIERDADFVLHFPQIEKERKDCEKPRSLDGKTAAFRNRTKPRILLDWLVNIKEFAMRKKPKKEIVPFVEDTENVRQDFEEFIPRHEVLFFPDFGIKQTPINKLSRQKRDKFWIDGGGKLEEPMWEMERRKEGFCGPHLKWRLARDTKKVKEEDLLKKLLKIEEENQNTIAKISKEVEKVVRNRDRMGSEEGVKEDEGVRKEEEGVKEKDEVKGDVVIDGEAPVLGDVGNNSIEAHTDLSLHYFLIVTLPTVAVLLVLLGACYFALRPDGAVCRRLMEPNNAYEMEVREDLYEEENEKEPRAKPRKFY